MTTGDDFVQNAEAGGHPPGATMLAGAMDEVSESPYGPGAIPSFDRVFSEHAPLVWRALRRLGVAAADIEDVCQEVFTTVHRRLPTFEGRSPLSTWIYGICVRSAWTYRRGRRRRRESVMEIMPEATMDAPQDVALERRRALAFADRVLDAIDDDKRAVFVLYEIEELPMKEVADAVGCPLHTAYARLYAARREFEAAVRRAAAQRRLP
jgi:RNA polymerase sigma-70 factor (ECF subfamily)